MLGERPRARILLEASTESEWVARCLEELGHEVIVADPNFAPMYATRTRRVKTDRRDARALTEACRAGGLSAGASALGRPAACARAAGGAGCVGADAHPGHRGESGAVAPARLRVPSGGAETFGRRVVALGVPGRLLSEVGPLLALMRPVNAQLAYCEAEIGHVSEQDPRVRRLRTAPSIGPVTAAPSWRPWTRRGGFGGRTRWKRTWG